MHLEKLNKYSEKTILCLDYGTKRIGLSLFRPKREPFPLEYDTLIVKETNCIFKKLQHIIEEEFVDHILLGIPTYLDGKDSDWTKKVRQFAEELQKNIPEVTLIFQDEGLSSYEAKDRMKKSPKYNFKIDPQKVDQLSACIIMEDFFSHSDK